MRTGFASARAAVGLAALVSLSTAARAQEVAPAPPPVAPAPLPPVRFFVTAGWDYGFQDLLKVELSDGSTQTLRLNGGYRLGLGAAFLPLRGGQLETRATVGVKYDWISAENGSARYLAFPVEVLEAFNVKPLRLSAGVSLLLKPSVKGEDFLADVDLDLKSSLGLVGQLEWILPFEAGRRSVSLGLRFTWQKLEPTAGGTAEDASALGAVVGVTL